MNNPDHSTYHDFDDDDPEVGISFNHRISFCLSVKLNDCDLLSPGIFCDLEIVSRIAFTFSCAALSLIWALSKNHYIFRKGSLKKRRFKCFRFCLLLFFHNFGTVNVVCFSSPDSVMHLLYVSLWNYVSICKESIHKINFIPV